VVAEAGEIIFKALSFPRKRESSKSISFWIPHQVRDDRY